MRIALDYDGTYTADPELWRSFIELATARGHEVICLAQRTEAQTVFVTDAPPMAIHYLGTQRKLIYARRNDIKIDVWIDDSPLDLIP